MVILTREVLAVDAGIGSQPYGFFTIPVHSVNFAAALGPSSDDTLSQDIVTVAGTYTVSFWLYNDSDVYNDFSVSFGGTQFASTITQPLGSDIPVQDYTFYSFDVTASTGPRYFYSPSERFWFLRARRRVGRRSRCSRPGRGSWTSRTYSWGGDF